MAILEINKDECTGCEACVDVCPFGSLSMVDGIAEVDDTCTACGACLDVCPVDALSVPERPAAAAEGLEAYQGVWVWVEQFEGQACSISWEMVGEGRKLADQREGTLTACLLGHNVGHIARQAIAYGADRVFWVDDASLAVYRTQPYATTLVELVREYKPEIFLF